MTNMKSLACKDLGDATCEFSATGETAEEVMAKMQEHVVAAHPDKAAGDAEAMKEAMMAAMKDA